MELPAVSDKGESGNRSKTQCEEDNEQSSKHMNSDDGQINTEQTF